MKINVNVNVDLDVLDDDCVCNQTTATLVENSCTKCRFCKLNSTSLSCILFDKDLQSLFDIVELPNFKNCTQSKLTVYRCKPCLDAEVNSKQV